MSDNKDLSIKISEDRLTVFLDCHVPEEGTESLIERIVLECKENKIKPLPKKKRLLKVFKKAPVGSYVKNLVILEGQKSVPPKNGRIIWGGEFFSQDLVVDTTTGIVDYRKRKGNPSVRKGQLIAHIIPPVNGIPGRDVLGKKINVPKPEKIRIIIGKNIETRKVSDGSVSYYSELFGRVRWLENRLSVDNVYQINGDIGLETGDIDHPGALIVEGDVLENSKIAADGDIEIRGTVEAANIKCNGSLIVNGGIGGNAASIIKSTGDVHAKFVIDANVYSGASIYIDNEIVNSCVHAGDTVSVAKGRIVGGEVSAGHKMFVGEAGSDGPSRTKLIIEEDIALIDRINRCLKMKKNMSENLHKLLPLIQRVVLLIEKNALNKQQKKAAKSAIKKATKLKKSMDKLTNEISILKDHQKDMSSGREIVINKKIFQDTLLRISNASLILRQDVEGKFRAILLKNKIKLGPID